MFLRAFGQMGRFTQREYDTFGHAGKIRYKLTTFGPDGRRACQEPVSELQIHPWPVKLPAASLLVM